MSSWEADAVTGGILNESRSAGNKSDNGK